MFTPAYLRPLSITKDWSLWGLECEKVQCSHGGITNIPNCDHPAFQFVDTFIEGEMNNVGFDDNLQSLLTTILQVWKEETLRNETLCILTSIATNQMLHEYHYGSNSLSSVLSIAKAILALENHNIITDDDFLTLFYHPTINAKFKYLNPQASGKRDVLKLLSRKVSCSCLRDMYRQARKMPKSRYCEYCLKVKERDELMLCGGCRLLGYCSIECQAADWKRGHENDCTHFVDYQHAHQIR